MEEKIKFSGSKLNHATEQLKLIGTILTIGEEERMLSQKYYTFCKINFRLKEIIKIQFDFFFQSIFRLNKFTCFCRIPNVTFR